MDQINSEIPNYEVQRESFLTELEKAVLEGQDIGIAADFDANISRSGDTGGLDPRDSHLDPVAKEALTRIRNSGRDVVIISSRGARDIARIVDIPGVAIVGTLGWETLKDGESHIHPQFEPLATQITGILGRIRTRFLTEQLGRSPYIENEPNVEFDTLGGGKIILQRKGYNEKFPEGINLTWNFNQVPKDQRLKYAEALERYYNEAFEEYSKQEGVDAEKLKSLCAADPLPERNGEWYSFQIRPRAEAAKSKAIIQLMRDPADPKRRDQFAGMPYHSTWIYSGDNARQDGAVMHAVHLADVLSKGKRSGMGVWSMPGQEFKDVRGADVVVPGVAGNAHLLSDMAEIFSKHPVESN